MFTIASDNLSRCRSRIGGVRGGEFSKCRRFVIKDDVAPCSKPQHHVVRPIWPLGPNMAPRANRAYIIASQNHEVDCHDCGESTVQLGAWDAPTVRATCVRQLSRLLAVTVEQNFPTNTVPAWQVTYACIVPLQTIMALYECGWRFVTIGPEV